MDKEVTEIAIEPPRILKKKYFHLTALKTAVFNTCIKMFKEVF